jgi:hypothetical protein
MSKSHIIATGLVSAGVLAATAIGIVSADPTSSGNVGSSDIPKNVFKEDRQEAASQVLNTTTTDIQTAHENHTMSQLISTAGLTKQTYHQKLKAQLTTDLETKGYNQSQVTIALQHLKIDRLHHKDKSNN